jgi:hypothetical protein
MTISTTLLSIISLLLLGLVIGDRRKIPPGYPPGLVFQTESEMEHLAYHKCRDGGEAYSAAYLTTREHIVEHNSNYSLSWVNCEMASFIMMSPAKDMNKEKDGQILQSLDVLDLSVVHLSAYERSQRKYAHKFKVAHAHAMRARAQAGQGKSSGAEAIRLEETGIEPVNDATKQLQSLFREQKRAGAPPRFDEETTEFLNRTVAVMPFLGTDMGSGHSDLGNRYRYLHTCFWSLRAYFPHVVVSVKSEVDAEYVRSSGMPVFDVLLNEGLPKSASLPVATVQHTRRKLLAREWSFDFVYYTESDQILLLRRAAELYRHLQAHPRRMFIPHRLMPYPTQVLDLAFHRQPDPRATAEGHGWESIHCCMPRQNCVNRNHWVPLANSSVPIVTVFGLHVPLGNANFLKENYRACRIMAPEELFRDPAAAGDKEAGAPRYCP